MKYTNCKSEFKVKKLVPNAKIPARATEGSAGYDLCTCITEPVTIAPGERYVFPTGIAVALPENTAEPFEYNATGSLPFATICDDSAFYITLNISRAELTQLPEQQFQVLISLPEGRELRGEFSHRRVEQGNGGDLLVYFFRIPEKDHERAFSMLGSNARATLIFNAPDGTMELDKGELARHPAAADCRNWEELIQKLYPEYHLILISERQILIRPR